ncbi:MAG: hypothetical protein AAF702_43920 [Chloroflexota bacterium]
MLYFQWILANLVGGLIIGVLSRPGDFLMHMVLRGLLISLAQWPVMRRVRSKARHWIWITSIGLVLSNLPIVAPFAPVNDWLRIAAMNLHSELGLWEVFWLNLLNEGQIWFLVGIAQWIFLRKQAPFWIVAALLGGLNLGATSATICFTFCGSLDGFAGTLMTNAIVAGGGWAAYGMVTGWALKMDVVSSG